MPSTRPAIWPPVAASRFASRLHPTLAGADVAILGLPDDLGVRLNNGRPGAAHGPAAFRAALATYGVAEPAGIHWPKVHDAGDVKIAPGSSEAALMKTHANVRAAAAAVAASGALPIGIGGGHDLTLPFVAGVMQGLGTPGSWAGVSFDAHLDVRETVGSGMPFRRLITEHGVVGHLIIGQNTLANSRQHADWFASNGGVVSDDDLIDRALSGELTPQEVTAPLTADPSSRSAESFDHLYVTFDMDVLDAAHAPGVSAINPCGLTVREASRVLFVLMQHPKVRCLDFMELSPPHDQPAWSPKDGKAGCTARVMAHLFLTALQGWKVGRLLSDRG